MFGFGTLFASESDKILFHGNDILQKLKQEGILKEIPSENYIAIEPLSQEYLVAESPSATIIAGFVKWRHYQFYVAPVKSGPIPKIRSKRVMEIGERVISRLRKEGKLEGIAADSYLAVEPAKRAYVVGSSYSDARHKGNERWGHDYFYLRPVDERLIPQL